MSADSPGDRAWREVHQAPARLPDEAMDRDFPIGPGTLRKTMGHLADAPS